METKYMSVAEFRAFGFLQEANRQFFHPLGLALEVRIDDSGNERLGGVWDYRDDPEGIVFDKIDLDKLRRVVDLQHEKATERLKQLGYIVQPPSRITTRWSGRVVSPEGMNGLSVEES